MGKVLSIDLAYRKAQDFGICVVHLIANAIPLSTAPLPLGGEGGPPPTLSSAGAGRVRGFPASGLASTTAWNRTLCSLAAMAICAQLSVLAVTVLPNAEASSRPQEVAHDQSAVATLPVLVLDRDLRPVTDLTRNELELFEGKEEQSIQSLTRSPAAPAKIGFLIDISASNAASLRALKLPEPTELTGGLLRAGDLAFVATFARTGSLLSPFTTDFGRTEKALHSAFNTQASSGGTSVYDALFWACTEELPTRFGHQALIVFSNMLDNSSNHNREEVLAQAQPLGIVIYPIFSRDAGPEGERTRGERVARLLADETGGVSFAVHKSDDLRETLRVIRADLDNIYVIAYRPKANGPGSVKVQCTRKGVRIVAPDRRY